MNDPSPSLTVLKRRAVKIAGHRTSVSLEDPFWTELKRIAATRRTSLNRLIADVDAQRSGNLSSAIRLFVLRELKREAGHPAS